MKVEIQLATHIKARGSLLSASVPLDTKERMKVFILLGLAAIASAKVHPLSDEFLEILHNTEKPWTAGRNFPKNMPDEFFKRLHCVRKDPNYPKLRVKDASEFTLTEIPDTFDAREQWPECKSIGEIRDQGNCGSCWAVAAAEVMTDRTCIGSKGTVDFRFSSQDVACTLACGLECDGGDEDCVLKEWETRGFVSGGRHGSNEGCMPYGVAECEHHIDGDRPPCTGTMPLLKCHHQCLDEYNMTYTNDKEYGKDSFTLPRNVTAIQEEIMTNGPVTAAFAVYEDFLTYKSGVYKHVKGGMDGYHAVKVIGWGEEDGSPYWLVANSWNYDWGMKGLFKILRGSDECEFEEDMAAALYKPT